MIKKNTIHKHLGYEKLPKPNREAGPSSFLPIFRGLAVKLRGCNRIRVYCIYNIFIRYGLWIYICLQVGWCIFIGQKRKLHNDFPCYKEIDPFKCLAIGFSCSWICLVLLTHSKQKCYMLSFSHISSLKCTFPYYSLVASPPCATSGVKHGDFFLLVFGSPLTSHRCPAHH